MTKRARSRASARLVPALFIALLLAAAPQARADGDPASDVLLGANVFYPYSPSVSATLQHQLDGITAAAASAGFPIKVALIGSPVDLGVIPDLFNKPSAYARFLDQEISFQHARPLLVVMPAGYGVTGLPAAERGVAASLPPPHGKTSNDLAVAALTAVAKLAAAGGHPVKIPPSASGGSGQGGGSSGGGGGSSSTLIVILAGLAAIVAAALIAVTVRDRRTRSRE